MDRRCGQPPAAHGTYHHPRRRHGPADQSHPDITASAGQPAGLGDELVGDGREQGAGTDPGQDAEQDAVADAPPQGEQSTQEVRGPGKQTPAKCLQHRRPFRLRR